MSNSYAASFKKVLSSSFMLAAVAAVNLAGSAQALNIVPVTNATFDTIGTPFTSWPTSPDPSPTYGWIAAGPNPNQGSGGDTATFFASGGYPEGGSPGAALLYNYNTAYAAIAQSLGSTWQVGTYTLAVDISGYSDGVVGNVNTIKSYLLSGTSLVGATVVGSSISNTNGLIGPSSVTFSSATPLVVTIGPGSPFIGTPIIVEFEQTAIGGTTPQTILDNVTLLTTVPEPASVILSGLGAVGLVIMGYRRRRNLRGRSA